MNQYQKVPLSDQTKEILLGSVLGDGSLRIHKPYKNARFSFRHSIKQKSYFVWKAKQFEEISSDKNIWLQKPDKGFSKNFKLRYQSRALESLTNLYKIISKRGKLKINRRWLNYLTPLSLAIWWLDDGSIISNGRKGVICTDGFDEKSVKALARYLQVVWNIRTKPAIITRPRNGKQKEYWRLWIRSTSELKNFLSIILPYIKVEEMLPKVILLYHDRQLQQRWISEIVKSTNFSRTTINKYVELKKNKWKQYQKKI